MIDYTTLLTNLAAPIVTSFVATIIAIITVVIFFNQWRIAHNNLRLSLFEKRFLIYKDALEVYQALIENSSNSKIIIDKFLVDYRASKYLFNKKDKIFELLDEFYKKASNTSLFLEENGNQTNETKDYLLEHFKRLEKKLNKYLYFKN
jgi:hypothetical protein